MNVEHRAIRTYLKSLPPLEVEDYLNTFKLPKQIYNVMYSIYVERLDLFYIATGENQLKLLFTDRTLKRKHFEGLDIINKTIKYRNSGTL